MILLSPSETLQNDVSALRSQLVAHPLYTQIKDIDHIKTFMEYHVFAVWDFMSLLKSLQRNLTCVSNPWMPVKDVNTSYLINEIVLGEETDVDEFGNRTSHFQLYLKAMEQAKASSTALELLFKELENTSDVHQAIDNLVGLDLAIKNFMDFTFRIIKENKSHVLAAVFTYGREDLIPDMFIALVNDLDKRFPQQLSILKYYLERHIEVDGEHHSILAYQMTAQLCTNDDQWKEATEAVREALSLRIKLWDAIYNQIK